MLYICYEFPIITKIEILFHYIRKYCCTCKNKRKHLLIFKIAIIIFYSLELGPLTYYLKPNLVNPTNFGGRVFMSDLEDIGL